MKFDIVFFEAIIFIFYIKLRKNTFSHFFEIFFLDFIHFFHEKHKILDADTIIFMFKILNEHLMAFFNFYYHDFFFRHF